MRGATPTIQYRSSSAATSVHGVIRCKDVVSVTYLYYQVIISSRPIDIAVKVLYMCRRYDKRFTCHSAYVYARLGRCETAQNGRQIVSGSAWMHGKSSDGTYAWPTGPRRGLPVFSALSVVGVHVHQRPACVKIEQSSVNLVGWLLTLVPSGVSIVSEYSITMIKRLIAMSVFVCLYVCPLAYLINHTFKLHKIFCTGTC